MTNEEIKKNIIDHYTRKYDDTDIKNECIKFYNNKIKFCKKILQNYISEILYKTKVNSKGDVTAYSFYDFLQNKDNVFDKFLDTRYLPENNIIGYFQLYSNYSHYYNKKGFTFKKPAYFNTDAAYLVLQKYGCIGGNYFDSSSGWGNRLLASMKAKMNYYGIDPNYVLVDRLYKVYDEFKKYTNCNEKCIIKPDCSEVFIPEYIEKMDISFTCPPYYDLEDYVIGNQSYKNEKSYKQWFDDFMKPTLDNSIAYVKNDGYVCLAVKNYIQWYKSKSIIPLFDDCYNYLNNKLKFIEFMDNHIGKLHKCDNRKDEKIMIFQKI